MVRNTFIVGLLLMSYLPVQARVVQSRGRDGRLYFTNVPSSTPQTPQSRIRVPVVTAPARTLHLIRELARQYDIEPRLIQSIIRVESNFNPRAVSRAGALGLMQLMPATARRFNVEDPFNPRANVEGGIRYLKHLLRRFPSDLRLVLAAYNAGEYAVQRYRGIPPYPETQRYVKRVMALYGAPYASKKIYRFRKANGSILFTNTPR